MNKLSNRLVATLKRGAPGFIATIPMSAVMFGAGALFPEHRIVDKPPQQITKRLAKEAGINLAGKEATAAAVLSHFGYGTVVGAAYLPLTRTLTAPPVLKGAVFGLGVWMLGYSGYLPALNLQPTPATQPRGRNTAMIAAHIVWGVSLALFSEQTKNRDL